MKGFPKYINSRSDLDNCAAEFPEQTRLFLLDILNFKDVWVVTKILSDEDDGLVDDTHKVVESKNNDGVVTQRYQYELMEDPAENGPIKRFGFVDGAQMQAYLESIVLPE
jgi:hypothetical protein